jgi:hypothetical protein
VKRGDILFVGSSGNNGTSPTMVDGKRNSSINFNNFPSKTGALLVLLLLLLHGQVIPDTPFGAKQGSGAS